MYEIDDIQQFELEFDTSYEDRAAKSRGEFLKIFPIESITALKLDDYVIGLGTFSFCACVEAKTRPWANIQAATSAKFGVYFGKKKSDPEKKYRYTAKFGDSAEQAFTNVKSSLLELLESGRKKDFQAIDQNKLSQLFKAKILSLYFPYDYINVCSKEHLEIFANELNIPTGLYVSQIQHLLVKEKLNNPLTADWSNPKFMRFLYNMYMDKGANNNAVQPFRKPTSKQSVEVDFDKILSERDRIGKQSEEYAIAWEADRLVGLGYHSLVPKIKDRRNFPADGFDYLSYSSPTQKRYIEVKSVGYDRSSKSYRFFLSENEMNILQQPEKLDHYYFYLVFYGKDGKPEQVVAKLASELYQASQLQPCAYKVFFEYSE